MKLSSSTAICRLGRCEVALRYGLGGTQRCEAHRDIYSTSSGVAVRGLHEDRGSEDSLLAVHVILLLHMLGEEGEQGARGKRPDSEQRKYGRT